MKLKLTEKDIRLMTFLKRYKIIEGKQCKKIYDSTEYHYKRLKQLEKEQYIKRVNRYYIKLDINGIKLMKDIGYDYKNICRKTRYKKRVKEIADIAAITLDSDIEFIPSWEMKDQAIFTETGRKYIGEIKYMQRKYITYYISKEKEFIYIKQVMNDIQKTTNYNNVLIFMEDTKMLNKSNLYFIFGRNSTLIINPTEINLKRMKLLQKIDIYEILEKVYKGKEISLSNWLKADFVTDDKQYIIFMPFIDTEKLHKLNIFYNNNKIFERKIDILTLSENKEKINEILTKKTNIIEIDNLMGGINGEMEKS